MTGDKKRIVSTENRKILCDDKIYELGRHLNLDWLVRVSVTQNLGTTNLFNDHT